MKGKICLEKIEKIKYTKPKLKKLSTLKKITLLSIPIP